MPLDLDAHEPRLDHLDRLYRVARALTGSAHAADGLVQDTHGPDLLVSLRRAFADSRRRRRPDPAAKPGDLYATIAALPGSQREAVAAVDVAGLSHHQAADLLGVPIGTVMWSLYRARGRVAAQLIPATV
jgi:DNA-directed RNA polymerase specialized sigma24 family protein